MYKQDWKRPSVSLLLTALLICPQLSHANDIRSLKHPLIGYWESTDAKNACKESYYFSENGMGEFASGEEKLSVTYEVDAQPDANGFFKMKHLVKSSNDKPDCTRSKSEIGIEKISYLLFQPDGYSFIACDNDDASLETCFGPIQLKGQDKN